MFTCQLQLPATVRTPGRVREEVQRRFARTLPPHVLDDLKLLATEIVTSAVQADGTTAEEAVQIRIDITRRSLHVEILGPGSGLHATSGTLAPAFDPDGVRRDVLDGVAARWGTLGSRPGGVWFELDL